MVDMVGLAHLAAGIAPETPPRVSLADEIQRNVNHQRDAARRVEWAREDGDHDRARVARKQARDLANELGALLERVRELEEGR